MPIYIYEHPKTGEQKEVVQRMTEPHEYSESGVVWKRVFAAPSAQIDSFNNLSPFDRAGFVKRTAKTGMTIGEMMDESKRMSDLRTKKVGKDFVKQNEVDAYKHRTGKEHPHADKPKPKYFEI